RASPLEFYTLSLHDALPISVTQCIWIREGSRSLAKTQLGSWQETGFGSLWTTILIAAREAASMGHRKKASKRSRAKAILRLPDLDRKSTRLNSSHLGISYAV